MILTGEMRGKCNLLVRAWVWIATSSATGSTVAEVKAKAMAHAQVVHADMLKTLSSPAQMAAMEQQLESVIK